MLLNRILTDSSTLIVLKRLILYKYVSLLLLRSVSKVSRVEAFSKYGPYHFETIYPSLINNCGSKIIVVY